MTTKTTVLLEVPEAAARLRICVRLYYRLVQRKLLPPPLKIGRKSLVPEADVEGYLTKLLAERAG